MGRLSTHVLDTASGRPASGVPVSLHRLEPQGDWVEIATAVTNGDGRTDAPLMGADGFQAGLYELRFEVAAYFRAAGFALPEPPFLDVIPIRFAMADPAGRYHVPLLVSPWSFSTYRGS